MTMPGQASGGFVESSSALRILYVGHRNSFSATLATDGFTQTNPPVVTAAAAKSATLAVTPKYGVLSGSVAFTRPDAGNGMIGGPSGGTLAEKKLARPLGLFINDAEGNAYENTPAPASGQAPYVSSQGTMGCQLYETQVQIASNADLVWSAGDMLYASVNGYLTNDVADSFEEAADVDGGAALAAGSATKLGIVKVAPDSTHSELVFDLRV